MKFDFCSAKEGVTKGLKTAKLRRKKAKKLQTMLNFTKVLKPQLQWRTTTEVNISLDKTAILQVKIKITAKPH